MQLHPKKEPERGAELLICMKCGWAVDAYKAYFVHLYYPRATSRGQVKYWHLCQTCGEKIEKLIKEDGET